MADTKRTSRAEKAVSNAKKKSAPAAKKETTRKSTSAPKVTTSYSAGISGNTFTSIVSLVLFILFGAIAINSDGALLKIVQVVVLGLIGKAGFYTAIPAMLGIFLINTLGGKHHAAIRTICVVLFILCCGSIYHLAVQTQGIAQGLQLFPNLYAGGLGGFTGGVLCGGIAILLRWACGNIVSYILLVLCAVLTLLGAMEITIPSLVRAIADRPRPEWEDEEEDEQETVRIEPAAVVVNHIANKQIERQRRQRIRKEESMRQQLMEVQEIPQQRIDVPAEKDMPKALPQKANAPIVQEEPPIAPAKQKALTVPPANAAKMMSIIDLDIDTPAVGDTEPPAPVVRKQPKPVVPVIVEAEEEFESIPTKMEPLEPTMKPYKPPKAPAPEPEKPPVKAEPKPGKVSTKEAEQSAIEVAQEIAQAQNTAPRSDYSFPPVQLLKRPASGTTDGTDEMRENSRRLNETLASFKIDAHIINVTRGPSVTRYEVELDKGVRLNKLTGCADDIALSLGASGVRIAAVPGKISIVGIEVPNRAVTTVSLREVIDSPEFNKAKSKSSFAVGKDIGGSCIVGNIAKMPHMLIAGTTGSGKSVCMNSIIISLLYKASPEDVKLIMVDPKMVELGIYNGIPHLLIPVVTDPKKAAGSLQWAVTEMLRRYKMMSDLGVRDLESYNSIVTSEENGQKLPQVVIIIDELADLMLVAAKEVEDSICRIAQMGRAAGMHLIIATQRPSADVITGLMKANIPSRIAFSVASSMESRIILDTQGAEKLVGKGDMLYAPIGIGKPLRVQGCFVTDGEVEAVAGYVKDNYTPDYNQDVLEEIERKAEQTGKSNGKGTSAPEPTDEELEGDEMLPAAVEVILETGQASVSMLQRRLKLGYSRAARIVDEMEEKGIVGPFQGAKPRAILITKEEWAARQGGAANYDEFDDAVPDEME